MAFDEQQATDDPLDALLKKHAQRGATNTMDPLDSLLAAHGSGRKNASDSAYTTGDVDFRDAPTTEPATPITLPPVVVSKPAAGPRAKEVTALDPTQEVAFQKWADLRKLTDVDHPDSHYDYRGFWLAGGKDASANGHFPDTYKQHGHPTFSVESKYSAGPDDGGHWEGDTFVPPTARGGGRSVNENDRPLPVPADVANADAARAYEKHGRPVVDTDTKDMAGHVPTHRLDQPTNRMPGESFADYERRVLAKTSWSPDTAARNDMGSLERPVADSAQALVAQAKLEGIPLSVAETKRTQERQEMLFQKGRSTPGPTATWTLTSDHTPGNALDFSGPPSALAWLQENAPKHGFSVMGAMDPGHAAMPAPAASSTVTVGQPVSVGTPKLELDRLANAPDLKTRINTRLALLKQPAGYVTQGQESAPDAAARMSEEIAAAPVVAAAKTGLYAGQRLNALYDAVHPPADRNAATSNELAAAMGVPTITGKEAAISAAQVAAIGLGPLVGKLAGNVTEAALAPVIERAVARGYAAGTPEYIAYVARALNRNADNLIGGTANLAEQGTTGAVIGASFDTAHPGRGAAIGAGLGAGGAAAADLISGLEQRATRAAAAEALAPAAGILPRAGAPVAGDAAAPPSAAVTPSSDAVAPPRAAAPPPPVSPEPVKPGLTPPERVAVRVGPITGQGAYFERTGGTPVDGAVPYDLRETKLADGTDPKVVQQITAALLQDPSLTPAQRAHVEGLAQLGVLDASANDTLPIAAVGQALGYDGLQVAPLDPKDPPSVFVWHIRTVKPATVAPTDTEPVTYRYQQFNRDHDVTFANQVEADRYAALNPSHAETWQRVPASSAAAAPASDEVAASSAPAQAEPPPVTTPELTATDAAHEAASPYAASRQGVTTLYHGTSPETALRMALGSEDKTGLFVTPREELALGQGGKGAVVEFANTHRIDVERHVKPGSDLSAQQTGEWPEYRVAKMPHDGGDVVRSVTLAKDSRVPAYLVRRAASLGWTHHGLADGRVQFRNPAMVSEPAAPSGGRTAGEFDTPEIRDLEAKSAAIPSTHTIDTPERNEWRHQQIDKMATFTKAGRVAQIIMGHAGSGKSSLMAEPLAQATGAALLDSDRAKAAAPEYAGGLGATALHAESAHIRGQAMKRVIEQGGNLVFPTRGDPKGTVALAKYLTSQGYTVHVHLMDVPPEVSARRMLEGFKAGTRHFVPPRAILEWGDAPRRALHALSQIDGVTIHDPLDNDVPKGTEPHPLPDWRERWGFPDSESPGGDAAVRPRRGPDRGPVHGGLPGEGPPAEAEDVTRAGREQVTEDGVSRFSSARTPSGIRRPVGRVSTRGLLDELLDLEQTRADAESRGVYEVREDPNFHTSGIPQIVSTKTPGGGPSMQAKAGRNLDDFARITDDVLGELARRMPKEDVWQAVEDARAERDERRGLVSDVATDASKRDQVKAGAVSFARAGGASVPPHTKPAPNAPVGSAAPPVHPMPEATGLTQQRPGIRLRELSFAIKALFNPESLGPIAKGTAGTIRHEGALRFRRLTTAREALRDFSREIGKLKTPEAVRYWDLAEQGKSVGNPAHDAGNALLRKITQERTDQLIALGRLKAEAAIANYLGRFWSTPTDATGRNVLASIMGKRPLEGGKSFLKHRSLERFTDGLDAGLIPATYNYVDAQLAKIAEMERLIAAERMLRAELASGRAAKVLDMQGREPPVDDEGNKWVRIGDGTDPAFTIFGPPAVTAHEAYDAQVRQGLESAIERLGVSHERKAATGQRGALGFAKGDEAIVSKFGSHDGVLMHELGHILDARYKLGATLAGVKGAGKELHDLAALRHETNDKVKPSFREYVQKAEERTANALHALIHAPERMADVAPGVKAALESFLASKPELAPILDIKPSLELATGTTDIRVPGASTVGHWYAPKPAAAVWSNHLSKGLRGNPMYDAFMAPVQAASQLMLGLSGFHGTVIAMEGVFSDLALAIDDVANPGGKASQAPLRAAGAAVAPVTLARLGAKVMREFRTPGTHPELAKVLDAMLAGGFRGTAESEFWTGERLDNLKRAFHDAVKAESKGRQLWGAARLPLDALWAGLEVAAKPILGKYVPLMKTGATYAAASRALAKLPADASMEQIHETMGDVVKEMDYRFGQVIYENHFTNNVVKHIAQMVFLAPGWTFGTATLMGRGVGDVGRAGKHLVGRARAHGGDLPPGTPPELVGKSAAYWLGGIAATMLINGLVTYLYTGEHPHGKDFWAFRDGTKDHDGNYNRHRIPGYLMHDVYGWTHHPVTTFKNKLSPALAFMERLADNKTYYGDLVYDPDAPLATKAKDVAKAVVKQTAPISVQNFLEAKKRGEHGPGEIGRSAAGIGPAPREFVRTPAQNKMAEYLARRGHTALTPEQADALEIRHDVLDGLRDHTVSRDSIRLLIHKGELTRVQAIRAMRNARVDPLVAKFKQLSPEEAQAIFALASPEEQALWKRPMRFKTVEYRRAHGHPLPTAAP